MLVELGAIAVAPLVTVQCVLLKSTKLALSVFWYLCWFLHPLAITRRIPEDPMEGMEFVVEVSTFKFSQIPLKAYYVSKRYLFEDPQETGFNGIPLSETEGFSDYLMKLESYARAYHTVEVIEGYEDSDLEESIEEQNDQESRNPQTLNGTSTLDEASVFDAHDVSSKVSSSSSLTDTSYCEAAKKLKIKKRDRILNKMVTHYPPVLTASRFKHLRIAIEKYIETLGFPKHLFLKLCWQYFSWGGTDIDLMYLEPELEVCFLWMEVLRENFPISSADMWTFTAKVVLELLGASKIPWTGGRFDTMPFIKASFGELCSRFNLTLREQVALWGGVQILGFLDFMEIEPSQSNIYLEEMPGYKDLTPRARQLLDLFGAKGPDIAGDFCEDHDLLIREFGHAYGKMIEQTNPLIRLCLEQGKQRRRRGRKR